MERLSRFLSYAEGVKSQTATRKGIKNVPNKEQLRAMKFIARNIFDPVRMHIGGALLASSFFRSPELNRAIGGSTTSQHCKGQAIDIDCDFFGNGTNAQVFEYIRKHLTFDQLIWEFGTDKNPAWVHVSLREDGKNRGQILVAYKKSNGRTGYRKWNNV